MKKILFSFLILISLFSYSQQFGGNPPSLKWSQINSDTARIIFPAGLDSQAQKVAAVVHFLAKQNTSLGTDLHKINIVLQNQTTIANGYVGLGPYRSEFFLTPPLNNFELGSIPWPEALAVHEYRHAQQFNNFRKGLSKAMYYLFGEEGLALAISAAIPDWFYEGDAVYNETVHTRQGRGRIPFFTNPYKALWATEKNYSWMKLRNGSLKDFVPSHYPLGYLLVNYGYERYGADFWKKVTRDAAAYKGLFYPFQKAIKRYSERDFKSFRNEAFDLYKDRTQTFFKEEGFENNPVKNVTPVNNKYASDYTFPYQAGDDSLIFLKTTYRHRPAFFIKNKDGEHRLRIKDISLDDQFSYKNGKIVYAAYETDPRWGWRDYSVIKLLDIQSGQQRTLTHKTKYFTPDITEDGSKLVAVDFDPGGKSELHILDVNSGEVLQRLRSSEINVFTDPKFIDNNSLVTAVRLNDGKMALAWADLTTGLIERLTTPSYNVLGFPSVYNNMIYFSASYFGNDDLFAIDLQSRKIYQVTSDKLGDYYANASGNKLVFSSFTADGYQLKAVAIKEIKLNEVNATALHEQILKFQVAKAADYNEMRLDNIPDRKFPVSKYSKATRLFNFHSWRPYYEDPEFTFSLYGQNVLNTFETELYYLYNQDEQTNAAGFSAVYGALFPVISAGTEYTFNRSFSSNNTTIEWDQLDSRIGLSVPLEFTKGRFFRFLNFGSSFVLRNDYFKEPYKDSLGTVNFNYLSHFINFSQQVQRARQHIYPRLGFNLSLQQRHAISHYDGYQFIGSSSLFLPGLLANHHIVLSGSLQQRDTSRALFSSGFANARGYADYYRTNAGSRMWRLSANYHLPLLLPDWGFGNILYLQRIRTNLFYDFQRLFSNDKKSSADLRSTGAELYIDTKWWNQYPLTFGIRINHLLDDDPRSGRSSGTNWLEIVLPVSILPR
jgi:hypothetical protein